MYAITSQINALQTLLRYTLYMLCSYLFSGTFGDVEHVFIVGGAGGVPHYTDYYKHVRLGDVVMSTPNDKGHIYVFCDKVL